jgi:hypothetical protein
MARGGIAEGEVLEAIGILTAAWTAEGRTGPVLFGLSNAEQLEFGTRCGLSQDAFLAAFREIVARSQRGVFALRRH